MTRETGSGGASDQRCLGQLWARAVATPAARAVVGRGQADHKRGAAPVAEGRSVEATSFPGRRLREIASHPYRRGISVRRSGRSRYGRPIPNSRSSGAKPGARSRIDATPASRDHLTELKLPEEPGSFTRLQTPLVGWFVDSCDVSLRSERSTQWPRETAAARRLQRPTVATRQPQYRASRRSQTGGTQSLKQQFFRMFARLKYGVRDAGAG